MIEHTYRVGLDGRTETSVLSAVRAIRKHCLECVGWSSDEVKRCTARLCALYPFRFGYDPGRRAAMTNAQRERRAEMARQRFHGERQGNVVTEGRNVIED